MSQRFLLLAILTMSSGSQESPAVTLNKVVQTWKLYMEECARNNTQHPLNTGLVCNRTYDLYACWPDGQPNTTVSVPCPWYLPWHHKVQHGMVYQECYASGEWAKTRNTSECDVNDLNTPQYGEILMNFWIMYTVGYSLSLVALVLALGILIFFRKLHCTRNNIHMNLFASFILRSLSILSKDALMESQALNMTSHDMGSDQGQGFPRASLPPVELLVNNETAIGCKIATVMMQYSIMASSYWLLVEGIYLHNLLVITVFTERNYFNIYLCIGWGVPLIFLVPWVIIKYMYENQICWLNNINMHYWWIIRSPILLAVVTNFLIFIHILKILVSKLRAHQMRYTDYKFRLAKSTLTLIPLLGIHLVFFIFVMDESTKTQGVVRLTKMFIDLFFSSFQGLLVAILYCFFNKEVQSEILKKWKRWKLGRNIEEEYRHTYSHPLHIKSSSLLNHAHQLPRLPDVTTTNTATTTTPCAPPAPPCDPEEKRALVGGWNNGTACRKKGGGGNCPQVEDIGMTDRARCYKTPGENAESHL